MSERVQTTPNLFLHVAHLSGVAPLTFVCLSPTTDDTAFLRDVTQAASMLHRGFTACEDGDCDDDHGILPAVAATRTLTAGPETQRTTQ